MTMKLGNAAGTCKTMRDFSRLSQSATDIITVGSITVERREGNPGTNHYQDSLGTSINSLGLPNKDYYDRYLSEMVMIATGQEKKLSVSMAILAEPDLQILSALCAHHKVPIRELNAGCPNVWHGGKQKRILSFDPEALNRTMSVFVALNQDAEELRVKLSPYSDPVLLAEIASVLAQHRITLVTSNTFPNAFMFMDDSFVPAIPFGKHLGGCAGIGMKPLVLGQIIQFRELLPQHRIVAAGGISTGRDLCEYERAGANEGQVGTAYYFSENPRLFSDILKEYARLTGE